MATHDLINNIVDTVIARINTNKVALGIGGVEERAEDPAVMDKVRTLGSYCYVIPLAEGRDRMDVMQGSPNKEMYHNFSFNVTSYFDMTEDVKSDESLVNSLRKTRDYAYDLVDFFNGDDNQIGFGYVYRLELEQGYYVINDRLITTYNIKFYVKSLDYYH
jgi:hypothetical protein